MKGGCICACGCVREYVFVGVSGATGLLEEEKLTNYPAWNPDRLNYFCPVSQLALSFFVVPFFPPLSNMSLASLPFRRLATVTNQSTKIAGARFTSTTAESSETEKTQQQEETTTAIPSWNDYFNLRKKRRMYEMVACVPSAIAPTIGSIAYFSQLEIDPFTTFFGMDPVMASALATVGAVSIF